MATSAKSPSNTMKQLLNVHKKENSSSHIYGFSLLDSLMEYWDKDGIIRRSSNITRRMFLHGTALPYAVSKQDLENNCNETLRKNRSSSVEENNHYKAAKAERNRQRRNTVTSLDEAVLEHMRKTNAYFDSKSAKIETSNKNTREFPSQNLRFVDEFGNIRKIAETTTEHDQELAQVL